MPLLAGEETTVKASHAGGPGAAVQARQEANGSSSFSQQPTKQTADPRLCGTRQIPRVEQLEEIRREHLGTTNFEQYSLASAIDNDIAIYDASELVNEGALESANMTSTLQNEFYHALLEGAGVLVIKNMYSESTGATSVIDAANKAFASIIASEKAATNGKKGDHFAASGKNSRIWNSFSKHALADAESFVHYYSNPWLALVSEAWLGPAYRVTTQVNIVRPGGAPQVSHRDYHLGFQTKEACAQFPVAMQIASQLLTLQGAVAHSDMPLESGPTRFLPFSQRLKEGYMAYRLPEFIEYFDRNWVSLPLHKGDGVFFNPALFHAAGENLTRDVHRSANLIQVSSAFGKPMETTDSVPIVERCWTHLVDWYSKEGMSKALEDVIKAIGEGYPFPTNLDRRPPAPGGMAPEDEQALLRRCLAQERNKEYVVDALRQMRLDSQA